MRGQPTLELSYSEAPIDPQRLLADRKAQVERETFEGAREYIPCPGGCGGQAFLENPLTVTRGGVTRRLRVAQCEGTCRHEVVSPRTGRSRSVVARFDIPCEGEVEPMPKTKSEETISMETAPLSKFAQELTQALEKTGLSQTEAGTQIGCSQSSVSKMLRDLPVADSTLAGARAWVTSVLCPQVSQVPSPETKPSNGPAKVFAENGEPKPNLSGNGKGVYPGDAPQRPHPTPPESTPQTGELSPYEAVLRTLLENAAQQHLRELAGNLADNIVARVTLEWVGSEER